MEIWKPIPGTNGLYQASNKGRIRSFHQMRPTLVASEGNQYGHWYVTITIPGERRRYVPIHRLVALTWIGPPPDDKPYVLHGKNGINDNSVENLRYGTHSDNTMDRLEFGTSKLTIEKIREIRKRRANGETYRSIGKAMGLDNGHISRICTGKAWANVE